MITENDWNSFAKKLVNYFAVLTNLNPYANEIAESVNNQVEEKFLKGGDPARWTPSQRATQQGGKTLQDTGQLAASREIMVTPKGDKLQIEISEKSYGQYHEYGCRIPITNKSRKFFWYKYKETGNPAWKAMAMTKKNYFDLPARPHLQLETKDFQEIFLDILEYYKAK